MSGAAVELHAGFVHPEAICRRRGRPDPLDGINDIFDRMKAGSITGRVVLDMANGAANGAAR